MNKIVQQESVDIILNPSASHFAFDKHETRKRLVIESSRVFSATYVYANLLGNEAGRIIYDGDTFIACAGKMVAAGPRFSFADHTLTTAIIDLDIARMHRRRNHDRRHGPCRILDLHEAADVIRDMLNIKVVRADFVFPDLMRTAPTVEVEDRKYTKANEFSKALYLGLFDYMRKSKSHGFVISLSGGADSAAVAALACGSIAAPMEELGPKGLRQKLSYLPDIEGLSESELTKRLLTCVYQGTRNSSKKTYELAEQIAKECDATFYNFSVDELVEKYTQLISGALGRELTWEQDDVALQNIQARVRAPSVWMLANINNALLLSTSNRSEAAVGYATMDGDTSGGLAPIAGIDKAFLLEWLGEMACHSEIRSLGALLETEPSAELRPLAQHQTDEDDLMPYPILDEIEKAAIRDKRTPKEVWVILRAKHPEIRGRDLAGYIWKFFTLWSRNQWKRERYAPSFHLDDENLDPKTWCRWPILSGGFKKELQDLHTYMVLREGS